MTSFQRIAKFKSEEVTMREWQSQSHVRRYCKYHVVFVPKYRKRSLYGSLRRNIGKVLKELCRQPEWSRWKGMRCRITSICV